MKNYYEILEVNEKASDEIIKKVFKIKIKENHPDLFQGKEKEDAEAKVKELNEAYEILIDPQKREIYNNELNFEKENILSEKEEKLINVIDNLKLKLQEKEQIINHFLGDLNLDEYKFQNNNSTSFNTSYDDSNLYNNVNNSTNEINNYTENNTLNNNTMKYYFRSILNVLFRLLTAIIAIVIAFIIVSKITNVNIFDIIFKTFFE